MRKDIGYHDHRDNGASVLTSAMAEDSSVINGVSTESIGPQVDGYLSLLIGLLVGFYFNWKVSLICLGLSPIMAVGSIISMAMVKGDQDQND